MRFAYALLFFSGLALAQRETIGQGIVVRGVDSEPTRSQVKSMRLESQTVTLETSTGQISIIGYPAWLMGQQLAGTSLVSDSWLRPDGPQTRLAFARTYSPFLIIGSRTAPGADLFGGWRFTSRIAGTTAFVQLLEKTTSLPLERNVLMKQGLLLWCVRLAALHLPQATQANVSNEAETPRFDWAALRVSKASLCHN